MVSEWANILANMEEGSTGSKVLIWAFLLAILAAIALVVRSFVAGRKVYICKACGTVGKSTNVTPGSFIIELFLWLLAIVPGLIYSAYRSTKRYRACSHCKSRDIIPKESPIAERIIQDNSQPTRGQKEIELSNWPPKAVTENQV